jgi:hypothetical protein
MSKGAKTNVQKTTQNQNASVDTTTRDWLNQIFNAAQASGEAGPSPLATGASNYFGATQAAGQQALNALAGNPAAAQQLMNPYQSQVIDALNKQYDVSNKQAINAVNNQATLANAFGGSRQGVAAGTALAANARNQNQQVAGLLNQGYSDTMNRASQLAGLGFGGANANANLGLQGVGSPSQWLFQQMRQGYIQPTGGTSGGATTTAGGSTEGKFKIPFFG